MSSPARPPGTAGGGEETASSAVGARPEKRSAFALPKSVDRGFVKMMATKRTFTGAFSLIGIVVITGIVVRSEHLHEPRTMGSLALAWLLLGAGGAWSLYDGIRLWKLLAKS